MIHGVVVDKTVAVHAVASHHGNDRRLGLRLVSITQGEESAIGSMTGGAEVMDLVVGGAQRQAGCVAGRGSMAVRASRGGGHPVGMIAAMACAPGVAGLTCPTGSRSGIMMNGAGRIDGCRMTGSTGCIGAQGIT